MEGIFFWLIPKQFDSGNDRVIESSEMTPEVKNIISPERKTKWKVWKTINVDNKAAGYGQGWEWQLNLDDIYVRYYPQQMIRSGKFITLERPEQIKIVRSTVGGLGFIERPTGRQLLERIKGDPELECLPPEAAVALRVEYKKQPREKVLRVPIKPTSDSDTNPFVFELEQRKGQLRLDGFWSNIDGLWNLQDEVALRLRPSTIN